jgi:hypothetical protein
MHTDWRCVVSVGRRHRGVGRFKHHHTEAAEASPIDLHGTYGSESKECGEGGIRTRGEVSPTQHFQCCAFGRSATSP